jgi:hypothetical protein
LHDEIIVPDKDNLHSFYYDERYAYYKKYENKGETSLSYHSLLQWLEDEVETTTQSHTMTYIFSCKRR